MLDIEKINLLQAQNEGLKKQNAEIQKEYNKLLQEIIADIPFTGIVMSGLTPLSVLQNIKNENKKLKDTLQEIKDYLNTLSGIDNDFVNTETYLRILDLITKAESEEV